MGWNSCSAATRVRTRSTGMPSSVAISRCPASSCGRNSCSGGGVMGRGTGGRGGARGGGAGGAPLLGGLREDHLPHGADLAFAEEHVLGAREPDALGSEGDGLLA